MRPTIINKRAHTLTELLVAGTIIVFLFTAVLGAFIYTKTLYFGNIASFDLQRDVDNVLATIIRGTRESTGTYGLRSAVSIPNPPGLLPSPGQNSLDFVGTDDNTRRYSLINNTIVYNSPTQSPSQQTIYTPPPNSTVTLTFMSGSADQQMVYIYISVVQNVANKTYTGSISTNVNLRNMPK